MKFILKFKKVFMLKFIVNDKVLIQIILIFVTIFLKN